MKAELAIIVPSRGRPENVAALWESWRATTTGDTRLVVVVDEDDPALAGYRDLPLDDPLVSLVEQTPNPQTMVAAVNQAARPLARRHFALGFMGDDHRPRTPGWDEYLTAALRTCRAGVVSGPDGFRPDRLPTWCAMTSNIVKILGYMCPPGLRHMYVDNAWQCLGEALGRYMWLPQVTVEHMHPYAGKANWDERYAAVNDPKVYEEDQVAFGRWLNQDLGKAVQRIMGGATVPA